MTSPQTIEYLPVSYSEPINALSRRLSLHFVEKGNGAWMLVHSGGIRSNRPSWTIDLVTIGDKEKFDPLAGQTRATGQNPPYVVRAPQDPSGCGLCMPGQPLFYQQPHFTVINTRDHVKSSTSTPLSTSRKVRTLILLRCRMST